MADIFNFKKYK